MHGSPEVGRLPSHLAPALLSACDVHFMGDRLPIQVPGGSAKQQGPARNHQQRVSQPEVTAPLPASLASLPFNNNLSEIRRKQGDSDLPRLLAQCQWSGVSGCGQHKTSQCRDRFIQANRGRRLGSRIIINVPLEGFFLENRSLPTSHPIAGHHSVKTTRCILKL